MEHWASLVPGNELDLQSSFRWNVAEKSADFFHAHIMNPRRESTALRDFRYLLRFRIVVADE